MDYRTRTPAESQPFRPTGEEFERTVKPPLERALEDDSPADGVRIECRTDDGLPFTLELDVDPPQDVRYAWNLSRGPPSPAPSTYRVLDRGRKYVLVESKAETMGELIQESQFLIKSIGGPKARLVDIQPIRIASEPNSAIWSRLRRVFDR